MFDSVPHSFFTLAAGIFGAACGSFFHVCVWRIPREESIVFPGSHCPQCGNRIAWYDNIPLLSYLFLLGACRQCQARIPLRYPIYELMTALLFMGIVHHCQNVSTALLYLFLVSILIVANGIDWDHQYIPDIFSIPMIPLSLIAAAAAQWGGLFPSALVRDLTHSLLGVAVGGGVIWSIRFIGSWVFQQEAMGFGDVKLMAFLGGFLGWDISLLCIFLAAFIGSIAGLGLKLSGRIGKYGHIPFGPYLAFGAYICLLYGPEIVLWYAQPFAY
ncbi:MAG: prepilin peptidase [Candidatus Omnitrophota bacterium]